LAPSVHLLNWKRMLGKFQKMVYFFTMFYLTLDHISRVLASDVAGLYNRSLIYNRDAYTDLSKSLHREFEDNDTVTLVSGPPGCGKSTTVLNFFLDRRPAVGFLNIWVHFAGPQSIRVIVVESTDEIEIFKMTLSDVLLFFKSVEQRLQKKPSLLILDGVCQNNSFHVDIMQQADIFREGCRTKLIYVSSVGFKIPDTVTFLFNHLTMAPWTLEEFIAACKFPDFFDLVKSKFNLPKQYTEKDIVTAVTEKFDTVGGSARWMFEFSIEKLLPQLGSISDHV
jgi:hypothetical protein